MAAAEKILEGYLSQVEKISAPVLLLVSENEFARPDHVQLMINLHEALESAGKQAELIIYPP